MKETKKETKKEKETNKQRKRHRKKRKGSPRDKEINIYIQHSVFWNASRSQASREPSKAGLPCRSASPCHHIFHPAKPKAATAELTEDEIRIIHGKNMWNYFSLDEHHFFFFRASKSVDNLSFM